MPLKYARTKKAVRIVKKMPAPLDPYEVFDPDYFSGAAHNAANIMGVGDLQMGQAIIQAGVVLAFCFEDPSVQQALAACNLGSKEKYLALVRGIMEKHWSISALAEDLESVKEQEQHTRH